MNTPSHTNWLTKPTNVRGGDSIVFISGGGQTERGVKGGTWVYAMTARKQGSAKANFMRLLATNKGLAMGSPPYTLHRPFSGR